MRTSEQKRLQKLACTERWRAENKEYLVEYAKRKYAQNRQEILAKKTAKRQLTRMENAAYARAYYALKRTERLAYAAAYRAANKAAVRAAGKAWRDANRDYAHALRRAWHAKNPEMSTVYSRERRARKKGNGGKLSRGITKKLMLLQQSQCAYCAADLSLGHHLDHKQPLSRGGMHVDSNVHLTCPLCNMRKHDKTHEEFLEILQSRAMA